MKYIYLLIIPILVVATSCTSSTDQNIIDTSGNAHDLITEEEIKKYKEIGLEYAMSSQQTLGKNLVQAIESGGFEHAISFCNTQAIPLTDSMSQIHSASIKRASDFPRNPDNLANAEELEEIVHFKNLIKKGKSMLEIEPKIKIENTQVRFYYPILTNNMCLNCHGVKNETVSPEVLSSLSTLYLEDKALGYNINEVRGIWSIEFLRFK